MSYLSIDNEQKLVWSKNGRGRQCPVEQNDLEWKRISLEMETLFTCS